MTYILRGELWVSLSVSGRVWARTHLSYLPGLVLRVQDNPWLLGLTSKAVRLNQEGKTYYWGYNAVQDLECSSWLYFLLRGPVIITGLRNILD